MKENLRHDLDKNYNYIASFWSSSLKTTDVVFALNDALIVISAGSSELILLNSRAEWKDHSGVPPKFPGLKIEWVETILFPQ